MHTTYIGLGGNIASWAGDPEATLSSAVSRLESLGRVVCRSSLYSTEPVGIAEQPSFVNAVIALETDLDPKILLIGLLDIEREFGRDRAAELAGGPRTLDLDILLYDNLRISEPALQIPHPRLADRAFVLVPLAEIAPQMAASASGETATQLLHLLIARQASQPHGVVPIPSDSWRSGCSHGRPSGSGPADPAGDDASCRG